MSVEIAQFYEIVRKDAPYTHSLQTSIPSLGTYYGLCMPAILLTVFYCQNPKTGDLLEKPIRFIFQADGRNDAILNLPHFSLDKRFRRQVCVFEVKIDADFGVGVVNRVGGSISTNLGIEKGVKGGVEGSVERSEESPGTVTRLHGHIVGTLNARERTLEAFGEIVGDARFNKSY